MPRGKTKERDGVYQRQDRPGWWASYVDASGKRKQHKLKGAHTLTQARAMVNAIRTNVERERVLGVKERSEISTPDLFDRYKRYQKARVRPATYVRTCGVLDTLARVVPSKLKNIDRGVTAEFVNQRSELVSPSSLHKEVTILKHCLRLAVEWGLIHENPAMKIKLPAVPRGKTRYLTPTELKMALEAAAEWMRAPLGLAAFTGMRRGEILGLKWSDVDLLNRRVYLRHTKNGDLRILVLNDLALQVLKSIPFTATSDLVFGDVDGSRLSVYTKRLFHKLGITGASFHTLRHTAASWLAMSGVDLYAIGEVLGHRTPRMTARYSHLSPHYMTQTVGKLDQVFAGVIGEPNTSSLAAGVTVGLPLPPGKGSHVF